MAQSNLVLNNNATKPGIDGCRAGWCVVFEEENKLRCTILKELNALENMNIERCLIDMPIGLDKNRHIDQDLRNLLKPHRHHSVFSVPIRQAVYAANYTEAKKLQIEATSKSISIQSWNICPKIRELDQFLDQYSKNKDSFIEAHPELCFFVLNKENHLQFKKSVKEGQHERLTILSKYDNRLKNLFDETMITFKRSELKADDILDAMVLFVSNQLDLGYLSNAPSSDELGLKMRIAYPLNQK